MIVVVAETMPEAVPEARVRIFAGRDVFEPSKGGPLSTAEKVLAGGPRGGVRGGTRGGTRGGAAALDALRQAALTDAASRAGMEVSLEADLVEPGRVFLWATGTLGEARRALDDLWKMGFSGYMAETDRVEAEDEISRHHQDVVWDVALLEGVKI